MRKHLVVWQKTKEQKGKRDYAAFTEYALKGGVESMYANPDVLTEDQGMFAPQETDGLDEVVQELLIKGKKQLTSRQWEAFELMAGLNGHEPHSIREAAVKMGVSPGRVGQLWDKSRNKLNQIYRESLDV